MDLTDANANGYPGRMTVTWTEPIGAVDQQVRLRDPIGREVDRRNVPPQGPGTLHDLAFERLAGPAYYTAIVTAIDETGAAVSENRSADVTAAGPIAEDLRLEFGSPFPQRPTGDIQGNAFLAGPAGIVIVRKPSGEEIDVAYPDDQGNYAAYAAGAIRVEAHAFDPQQWRGVWQAEASYERGDAVVPTGATKDSPILEAQIGGTTGATEPAWDGTDLVQDGGVQWKNLGAIKQNAPIVNLYDAG